jgi:choline dehydrogenase
MKHDYVIVGAGSAGCVLAGRLSEEGASVLLLEAGGKDRSPNIKIPAAFAKQFHTKLDWDFETEPEPGCEGRRLYVPRGKSLGGSSSMNAMLYVRGRPLDFDGWREAGCPGWGWDDVEPYFRRSEGRATGADEVHGGDGPLQVTNPRSPSPLTKRMIDAAQTAGIPFTRDYNSPEQDGVGWAQVTQKGGRRWSAADAYLRPALNRPNLAVETGAHVLGLELRGERAHGVRYRDKRGREQVAEAGLEVILSAGSICSPQILLLSGIGPEAGLREAGIEPKAVLPGVGENLQDHVYCVGIWESSEGGSLADAEKPKAVLEYLTRRSGPLSSSVAEALAFLRTKPGLPAADIELHLAPAYFNEHGADTYDDGHALTIGPTLLTPKSRGRVWLSSSDPFAKPRILGNHLTEADDVAAMVAGMKRSREIAASEPLASIISREFFPGPAVGADDDEAIEADIRHRAELIYHPVGTCRMGSDDEAVVDPELKVRGVEGLRVVDASVMPTITGGNTHAPTVMIAERAADLIRGRVGAAA